MLVATGVEGSATHKMQVTASWNTVGGRELAGWCIWHLHHGSVGNDATRISRQLAAGSKLKLISRVESRPAVGRSVLPREGGERYKAIRQEVNLMGDIGLEPTTSRV